MAIITSQLVAEYGCESCTGPELFSRIFGVAAGAANTFAVIDRSAPHVRVWNLDTGAVTQFGRSGQGPGELQRPMGLVLLGDSIGVGDTRGGAGLVEFYTSAGAHLSSQPGILAASFASSRRYIGSPSGRWTLWIDRDISQQRTLLVRTNAKSGARDTIAVPQTLLEGSGASWEDVSAAISDLGEVALGVGQVEYRLTVVSTDGAPRVSGGREIERQIRSPEELAREQRAMDSLVTARGGTLLPQAPPIPREIFHFSTGGPWSGALHFDGRGRLWVATTRGWKTNTTVVDVFDPNLEYLGEIDLGTFAMMRHIGSTLLVASVLGDFGVQMVRVWRIQEP
jgi:hypothetical protein